MDKKDIAGLISLQCSNSNIKMDKLDIEKLIQIECLLHFCFVYQENISADKAYYILLNQHKLGRKQQTQFHWMIDNLRTKLFALSSSENYKNALRKYCRYSEKVRLYQVKDNKIVEMEHLDKKAKNSRVSYYEEVFRIRSEIRPTSIQVDGELKVYQFEYDGISFRLNLEEYDTNLQKLRPPRKKKGGNFTITIEELLIYAREVDEKIRELIRKGEDIEEENYEERLKHIELIKNGTLGMEQTKELTISQVCNIIGMVGAGKTTLMVILAYAGAKEGYRICLVLDGIPEVFRMNALYERLGVKSCYLTGVTTINEQIKKVTEEGMYTFKDYSSLMATCILDGVLDPNDELISLKYGTEPCYSLNSGRKRNSYLCPFYSVCPRKKNENKMAESDIIITHIASLNYGKSYFMPMVGQVPFLYYVLEYIDLVVFDEADKLLVTLDKTFLKEIKITDYLHKNMEGVIKNIAKALQGNNQNVMTFNNHYMFLVNCIYNIRNQVNNQKHITEIGSIKSGKWFTGRMLAEDLFKDNKTFIDEVVLFAYNDKMPSQFEKMERAISSHIDMDIVVDELMEFYKISDVEAEKVRFIITLMLLERKIIELSSTIDRMDERDLDGIDIIEIARSPFRRIRELIPTAPLGNIFGYIFDKEEKEITMFRQFGIGRSIMLDMPYLRINFEGNALGPNVIYLSGTSFAEGSTRYHIPKPVNYIIKSPKEILEFINKTEIQVLPTRTKVSGKPDKIGAVKQLVDEVIQYISAEIVAGHKLLLIVNSYEQAKTTATYMKNKYHIKVASMVSDNTSIMVDNWIKRSEVQSFGTTEFNVLVAVASIIDRGFNIIDEEGHSIFDRLIFLVRPMDVPRNIDNIISEINGKIYEMTTEFVGDKLEVEINNIKKEAYRLWDEKMSYYYAIGNKSEDEKKEIVVSRLVLILQIYGRLLRVRNYDKYPPKIYFADAAFTGSNTMKFDILDEMKQYLAINMEREDVGEIFKILYGPFYEALIRR